MSIALSVTVYQPGAGGIPTTTVLATLGGRIDDYEHTITNEIGFDSMRSTFSARDLVEAVEWMNNLGASVVVSDPEGRTVWEGLLFDVDVKFGRKMAAVSLDDVANSVRVKYSADSGAQAATSDVTSAASIARYGTKQRAINFSTSTAAAASARAAVVLSQTAWPRSKQSGGTETGSGGGGATITLQFRGWWHTLDWLLLASVSTTTTITTTQVAALIVAYNAINAFFSTSTARITATGVSDTEYVESETTYAEQIPKLLSSGNSSSQRVVFGIYENRALTVEPWAGATPSVITYYESDRDQVIRDAYGNIVEPWSLRPNAMAQLVDLVEPTPASGPIDTLTRRYIKRVTCRISRSGVSGTLEPDDVDTLEELLTRPTGGTATGSSDRQNKVERTIAKPARTRFSGTDGTVDLGGGSITTGGGSIDLTSGGGEITLPGGGGTITLPPPSGGGSSTILDGGGTAGQLAKWSDADTLTDATAGTDYATAGHTHTPSGTGLAPIGAKYIVQEANADLTNEQSLGLLTTGLLKNTVTTGVGVLSTAVAGTDYVAPGTVAPLAAKYIVQEADATLTNEQSLGALATGIVKNTTTTGVGVLSTMTGTSGRVTEWSDGTTIGASTLIKSGAGVLTLSAASSLTLTLSGGSATLDFTTPSSGDVLQYDGTKFTPTALSAAPTNATYITQTANSSLSNEQALGALATGMMKSTTSTGVVSTVTGTSGRITEWSDGTTIGASTLIKSGAGVLTLSAASTQTITISGTGGGTLALAGGTLTLGPNLTTSGAGATLTLSAGGSYTLTVPATGTAVLGTGANKNVPYFTGTNTIGSTTDFQFDNANSTLTVRDQILVQGSNAGFYFDERDGSGSWVLYATGSTAYIALGATNLLSINNSNQLDINGTQVLTTRRTGWAAASGTATRTTFATSTVTTAQLAERVKALIDDLVTHGLIGT